MIKQSVYAGVWSSGLYFPLYLFFIYKEAIVAALCVPKSILASIEGKWHIQAVVLCWACCHWLCVPSLKNRLLLVHRYSENANGVSYSLRESLKRTLMYFNETPSTLLLLRNIVFKVNHSYSPHTEWGQVFCMKNTWAPQVYRALFKGSILELFRLTLHCFMSCQNIELCLGNFT